MVAAVAIAGICAASSAAGAQAAQRYSFQASGLYTALNGDAYENISNGVGVEAQLRINPSALSFGAGFQYTHHDIDEPSGLIEGTVTLWGAFFEPRYVVNTGSNIFAPYFASRLAVLRQNLDVDTGGGTSATAHATGVQLNVGGGVLWAMTPRLNLDIGATYGYIKFGEPEFDSPDIEANENDAGGNLVFRVGLAIGIGR
jgi:hypothetical protein